MMIKSHGAADQQAFTVATEQAVQAMQRQVLQRVVACLEPVYPIGFELLGGNESGTLWQQDAVGELAVYK